MPAEIKGCGIEVIEESGLYQREWSLRHFNMDFLFCFLHTSFYARIALFGQRGWGSFVFWKSSFQNVLHSCISIRKEYWIQHSWHGIQDCSSRCCLQVLAGSSGRDMGWPPLWFHGCNSCVSATIACSQAKQRSDWQKTEKAGDWQLLSFSLPGTDRFVHPSSLGIPAQGARGGGSTENALLSLILTTQNSGNTMYRTVALMGSHSQCPPPHFLFAYLLISEKYIYSFSRQSQLKCLIMLKIYESDEHTIMK